MTCTLTTEPVTIDELMTNIAFTNEVLHFKTEAEALAMATKALDRETRFGRVETVATVSELKKFYPRGRKWQLFIQRCGR